MKDYPTTKPRKDEEIKKELGALMLAYSKLAEEGVPHGYADDVTRFAYVYKYATTHANAVHQLVPRFPSSVPLSLYQRKG